MQEFITVLSSHDQLLAKAWSDHVGQESIHRYKYYSNEISMIIVDIVSIRDTQVIYFTCKLELVLFSDHRAGLSSSQL